MDLGRAIATAAKFGTARSGGCGKVWIVGDRDRRMVLSVRGPAMLALFSDATPDGVTAVDAADAQAVRSTLEGLGPKVRVQVSSEWLRVVGPDGSYADLPCRPATDVPALRDFRSATWARLSKAQLALAQRVARVAAEGREDRPGLEQVQLGTTHADSTDEVCVARADLQLPFTARVPASLLDFAPKSDMQVGDLGGSSVALRAVPDGPPGTEFRSEFVAVVQGQSCWFPALGRVWAEADRNVPGATCTVLRLDAKRAVVAAAAGVESDVVALDFLDQGLSVGGGAAFLSLAGQQRGAARGRVLVSARALGVVLGAGGKAVDLHFRSAERPLEVSEETAAGRFRALIFPVVQGR